MGPILTVVGLVMVITGAKGTHGALGNQLVKDFTGENNFIYWVIAIVIVGAIAYIPGGEKVSRPFLILIVSAILLKNGGFFQKFMQDIKAGPIASPRETPAPSGATGNNPIGKTAGGGSSEIDFAQIAMTAAKVAVVL